MESTRRGRFKDNESVGRGTFRRPRSSVPRDQPVLALFNAEEMAELDRRRGQMARGAFLAEAATSNRVGGVVDRSAVEAVLGLEYELRKIGNNLNQIARGVNATGEHSPAELQLVLGELFRTLEDAGAATERLGR